MVSSSTGLWKCRWATKIIRVLRKKSPCIYRQWPKIKPAYFTILSMQWSCGTIYSRPRLGHLSKLWCLTLLCYSEAVTQHLPLAVSVGFPARRMILSLSMSGLRKMSGNELQTDGLATEKVYRRDILSRYTAVRREVDDWQIADVVVTQRRRLASAWP